MLRREAAARTQSVQAPIETRRKRMQVLFITLPARGWDGSLTSLPYPHTGVGYLIAYLKERGVDSAVLDTSFDFANHREDVQSSVRKHSPDLVGLTLYSNIVDEGKQVVEAIRNATHVPIVAGGPHISVTDKEFLEQTGAEFGVMRDGEIPLYKLADALSKGGGDEEFSRIPGLVFRNRNGKYVVQQNTDLIRDLDELPFPDLTHFDLPKYPAWRRKFYGIITSRGCPYACTYCAAPLVTGRRFRIRSAANVVDEIEANVKKGFKRFGVGDDAFNVDLDRAKEVCRLIIDRKLDIVWDMGNGIRANTVDREFFQLLKKAGCNFVGFGMESGNDEILKKIKKGLKVDDVFAAVRYAREAGIGTAVNFILGHPGETYETALDTIRIAEKLPASYVNIYGLIPFKGTEAYTTLMALQQEGKAHFLYEPDYYLSHSSPVDIDPVFETPEFTAEQRRELLVRGRNITKRRAMEYRFGRTVGRCIYPLVKNQAVFNFVISLRETSVGSWLYSRIRHED
ncbi:MAG: B12-binding domain-containing radical SAM protein [Lentisphaerae bacterium]|nr:B12-binding domain-containing radical SAM protein [Lentisphaerota bacterium]